MATIAAQSATPTISTSTPATIVPCAGTNSRQVTISTAINKTNASKSVFGNAVGGGSLVHCYAWA